MDYPGNPWSGEQVGWLQALGHVPYLAGGALDAAADAESDAGVDTASARNPGAASSALESGPSAAPARRVPTSAHTDRAHPAAALVETLEAPTPARRSRMAAATPDSVPPPQGEPLPRRGGGRMPDRLQMALLRASGLDPAQAATRELMATWPLAALRRDPAAKRALWPALRALRRGAAPDPGSA